MKLIDRASLNLLAAQTIMNCLRVSQVECLAEEFEVGP